MYQPIALFIGLRYIRRHAADRFSRFISWLSAIGMMLGVVALVIVLSVMNGFERELQKNILGLIPQAIILSTNSSLNPKQLSKEEIKKQLQDITHITPLTTCHVVLQSSYNIAMGVILGIDPAQEDPLTPYLINVKQTDLISNKYNIILGEQLAYQLGVNRGDQLRIIVPSASQFTPIGRFPNQRIFNVIGTFSSNSEVDSYQMLVNIQDASRLMRYPIGNITGWRLWLKDPMKVNILSQKKLPKDKQWKDWREQKGEFFQAVRMEKNMMRLFFSLIIIVSGFNTITLLSLAVIEKKHEVAILQTYGLTQLQIAIIFMIQGACMGIIGVLFGSMIGVFLANQLNNFIPIISIFFNQIILLPIEIKPLQIINIALTSIMIVVFSTFYPSWRAAKIQPAEVLRYE